jgi:hypothetical protein
MSSDSIQYQCGNDGTDMTAAVRAACREMQISVPVVEATARAGERTSVSTRSVRVQCKDGKWCDFPCGGVAGPVVKGTPVPAAEEARWGEWQKYVDPMAGLKRLDGYATWLFGAFTIVILLASGLVNNKDPGTLDTSAARWLFGLAVAALGFSWVFTSLVKAPSWGKLNRHSPDDHLQVFAAALTQKRRRFAWASSLLGLSLALAALIPLARSIRDKPGSPDIVLTYDWATDSSYKATLSGSGLRPNSVIEIRIEKNPPDGGILPVHRAQAGADGKAIAQVAVPASRKLQPPFRLVAGWREVHRGTTSWVADTVSFTSAGVQQSGTHAASQQGSGVTTTTPASDSTGEATVDSTRS